ncbi:MAG: methyltransferase [Spirulinaceae cyanobacterium]
MKLQSFSLADQTITLQEHPKVWSPFSADRILQVLLEQGYLDDLADRHVLDFCTGSGILGIMCGRLGAAAVTLSDYCTIALAIATQNAHRNGLTNVRAIHSDRFAQIPTQSYDLILCNPPVQPWLYTDLNDQAHRQRVEAWNEAGADGRLVLDSLLLEAMDYLKPGGKLVTATSSRHGYRKTQRLLDHHWPGRWREIYRAEQRILPAYHGPYLQSWLEMQTHDLDWRVYQKDEHDRPFAVYTDAQGEIWLLTDTGNIPESIPICWQRQQGIWQAIGGLRAQESTSMVLSDAQANRLLERSQAGDWYYTYHLLEAVR